MRKSALIAGLLFCVPILLTHSPRAHAESNTANLSNSNAILADQTLVAVINPQTILAASKQAPAPAAPAITEHVVVEGETLTVIASNYQTNWQRLFAKNTQLQNPNIIDVGQKIIIPDVNEQLPERALPVAPAEPAPQPKPAVSRQTPQVSRQSTAPRGSAGGNSYTPGYCTWYAKNRRPDLPNNLGNAYTWVSNAAAQGIPTGSASRAGAIGQAGNHVVYVESVNGDGTVTVSEMNHVGWNIVSSRTVPASYFTYIY